MISPSFFLETVVARDDGRIAPVNKAGAGLSNPINDTSVTVKEAGWHARMSSRLAGKGACAWSLIRLLTSGFGRRPKLDIGGDVAEQEAVSPLHPRGWSCFQVMC